MRFKTLDVGCGNKPQGDVNIDLYPNNPIHREGGIREQINVKNIPNFIVADACHLPFKNNTFQIVIADNIVEHLENPVKAIKEFMRVASQRVKMIVPHRYWWHKVAVHVNYFTYQWFRKVATLLKASYIEFVPYMRPFLKVFAVQRFYEVNIYV